MLLALLSGQYLLDELPTVAELGGVGVLDCEGDNTGMEGEVDSGDGEFIRMEARELGDDKSLLSGEEFDGEGTSCC